MRLKLNGYARSILYLRKYSSNVTDTNIWTKENIVNSPFPNVDIPNSTVSEHIFNNLEKWADKTAIICGVSKKSYTYHELYKKSRSFAVNLRTKFNIQDGDVICIMMANNVDYPVAVMGILQAGAQVSTISPIYTAHEIQKQFALSKPRLVIGSTETVKIIKESLNMMQKTIPIICIQSSPSSESFEGLIKFDELALNSKVDDSILRIVKTKSNDIAFLPYSSGTTGFPKGVQLSHFNIVANFVQQDEKSIRHYSETTNTYQDVALAVLPFFHIYGLSAILLHKISVGIKLVSMPSFQPNLLKAILSENKVSIFFAVPPLVSFLGSNPNINGVNLKYLKKVICGAAPLPKSDILETLKKKPDLNFLQLYGLTETSPIATSMIEGSDNYTSSGYALSNTQLKIVDKNNIILGPNKVGELLIKGPQVMVGYKDNPEANHGAFAGEGWFRTGDLASIDKHGAVTIEDRLKELIKVKGFQVPPAELESVLKEHSSVLDAAVIGIPDKKFGEVPKAFIVLKSGHQIQTNEIMNFVKERVAPYKMLKEVVVIDSIPKNPSGKILKRILRER